MDYEHYIEYLKVEGERFAALAQLADVDAPVPSCPDWCVADLLAHMGYIHRWARFLVDARARERIATKDMALSSGPVNAQWLAQGVDELLVTLRGADPEEEMWAWGEDQHVRFWARRQLHETLIHRVDLEGALGLASDINPAVGADAIDEFFANLARAGRFSPKVKNLVGTGECLQFACDDGPTWSVELRPEGFSFLEGSSHHEATLSGPTSDLLYVIYRRRALGDSTCVVQGRGDLVDRWLENSALD
jgi:uncharacterized protein (TIGR03083 family)